jgi:hypothetical protein
MGNALQMSDRYIGQLAGKIEILNHKLEVMSANGEGGSKAFKEYAKQLEQLTMQQEAVQIIQDSLTNLFSATKDQMSNFADFIKSWAQSVMQAFQRMVAELLAKKVLWMIIKAITKVPIGGGGMGDALPFQLSPGGGAMAAKGGIVPKGFPRDTYPAMLSSDETVVPAGKIYDKSGKQDNGRVEFVIKEDRLSGILKKGNARKSLI